MLTESEIARSDHTPASVPDTKGAEQLKMQMRQASKASHVATAATAHVHSHSPLNH